MTNNFLPDPISPREGHHDQLCAPVPRRPCHDAHHVHPPPGRGVRPLAILSNVLQAIDQRGGPNAWEDGYPGGGNYWTNYQGIDQCSGPAQDEIRHGPADRRHHVAAVRLGVHDGAHHCSGRRRGHRERRAEVRVNGGPWTVVAGTSPWSLSVGLAPGGNLIEARCFDHAGNVSAVKSISVTYQSPLATEIMTDKTAYAPGEPVAITLLLTNRGTSPVTLNFPSSCEAFFSVLNMFTQRTVEPGQTVTYSFEWDQVNDSGQQVPAPADYRIRGFLDSGEFVPDAFTMISVGP